MPATSTHRRIALRNAHRHPFDEDVKVKLALTTWRQAAAADPPVRERSFVRTM